MTTANTDADSKNPFPGLYEDAVGLEARWWMIAVASKEGMSPGRISALLRRFPRDTAGRRWDFSVVGTWYANPSDLTYDWSDTFLGDPRFPDCERVSLFRELLVQHCGVPGNWARHELAGWMQKRDWEAVGMLFWLFYRATRSRPSEGLYVILELAAKADNVPAECLLPCFKAIFAAPTAVPAELAAECAMLVDYGPTFRWAVYCPIISSLLEPYKVTIPDECMAWLEEKSGAGAGAGAEGEKR